MDNVYIDVQQWIFKMDIYLSPVHRRMIKDEQRRQIVAETLPQLGLTQEIYNELKSLPHFVEIIGLAIENGITFFSAEIQYFTDRENANAIDNQNQFFVEFPQNSFADERALYRKMFR